jgi:polyisoprenoid-binding protein YceI
LQRIFVSGNSITTLFLHLLKVETMKRMNIVVGSALVALVAFFAQSALAQNSWSLDKSHSSLKFGVKHLVVSEVEGSFKSFTGSVKAKDDTFADAQIEFAADVNSVNTDDEKRDGHLKSDDFFNAEKFPQMKFVSKSFKKAGKDKYKLTGDLTIRDVTKTVTFDVDFGGVVKDPWGNIKAGFKATTSINRFDYNLKWNTVLEAGGAVVGKEIKITANIEMAKAKS